jgi:hypothetical protein
VLGGDCTGIVAVLLATNRDPSPRRGDLNGQTLSHRNFVFAKRAWPEYYLKIRHEKVCTSQLL